MSKWRVLSYFTTAAIVAAAVAAVLNAQLIRDTVLYYQYTPSETIADFVDLSGMNERGEFLFYASHPSLEDAESFNQHCARTERAAAILGCYSGEKIYIYDITDPRLEGIRPTTAAHEMLHAAYGRLSEKERDEVNALLEAEYAKLKDNDELSDRMAFYAVTQPGDRANELHSIIGTEISVIGAELEEYYSRYFSDRTKVIAQHQQYHSVFDGLRARADALNVKIDQLEGEIQNKRATYATEVERIQRDIENFNMRAKDGDFETQAEFSTERQALVARTVALESVRADINSMVTSYNSLVDELNSVAVETNGLNRSIDSNLAPAPSI